MSSETDILEKLARYYTSFPSKEIAIKHIYDANHYEMLQKVNKAIQQIYKMKIKKIKQAEKQFLEMRRKMPTFVPGKIDKKTYQKQALEFILKVPEQFKLKALNSIQDNLDFVLLDLKSKEKFGKMKYGPADLLHFLGIEDRKLIRKTDNPFYAPIKYPIPDYRGNAYLNYMYDLHNSDKYMRVLFRHLGDAKRILKKKSLTPKEKEIISSKFFDIFQIYNTLENLKYNPIFVSKTKQTRPMENYRYKHLVEIINDLKTYDDTLAK